MSWHVAGPWAIKKRMIWLRVRCIMMFAMETITLVMKTYF